MDIEKIVNLMNVLNPIPISNIVNQETDEIFHDNIKKELERIGTTSNTILDKNYFENLKLKLKEQDINIENEDGSIRNFYDVLMDISKKYNKLVT